MPDTKAKRITRNLFRSIPNLALALACLFILPGIPIWAAIGGDWMPLMVVGGLLLFTIVFVSFCFLYMWSHET